MSPRDRILTALSRGLPDRVPVALGCFPMALPHIPNVDPDEYFETDIRYVTFESPSERGEEFLNYLRELPKHISMGEISALRTYWEWGYHPERPGSEALLGARTVEELNLSLLRKMTEPSRYISISERVRNYQEKGMAVMGMPPHLGGDIFETAWRMRGFQQFLLDFRLNRELANYLLDQITNMLISNILVLVQAGVDILCLDDDVGDPRSMIISPAIWREFLKSRMAKAIELAKEVKPNLLIFYHSDGCIEPIIPDLIEIGVDVINPLQPDVMDPRKLKEEYGNRLSFWGAVGSQTLWSWGRPEDMEREVKFRIETVGRGGGFVISPAYDIDLLEIPLGNIVAFNQAAKLWGRY
jgi:uroporphyrinogen decarboxylase